MKLYNIQILNLYETLNEFSKQISESLPIRLGFKILTNSKILQSYYDSIQKMRNEIVLKYATINEDGSAKVPEDKIQIANKELNELLSIEIDVEGLQMLDLKEFEARQIELPLAQLNDLMPIIKEEE